MKSVGERIRQARDAKGMSAEMLAARVGYKTQSGIANLENRATGTGGTKLPAIAKELNVDVEWLLSGPDSDTVPFRRMALEAIPGQVTRFVAEHDPQWPFQTISRQRVETLLSRLRPARSEAALADIERYLDLLLSRWEDEANKDELGVSK